MSSFQELPTTIKGSIGEDYIRRVLRKTGYNVYFADPDEDKPHWLDFILLNKKTDEFVGLDIKSKSKRLYYDDTGINLQHYLEYKKFSEDRKCRLLILFLDEIYGLLYGQFLDVLDIQAKCNNRLYPIKENNKSGKAQIYFPLSRMRLIDVLPNDIKNSLFSNNTKHSDYVIPTVTEIELNRVKRLIGSDL